MDNDQILIYQHPNGETTIDVKLEHETVWLTQTQTIDLFQSSRANISEHIKHIYNSNELGREATIRKFRIVQQEGKRSVSRELEHYNLDMIISIGYRVNSIRGTQFRIWANKVLKEYLVSRIHADDCRIKAG